MTAQILIVEDDAGLREALCDTLLLAKYQVLTAANASEALQIIKAQQVDLVITDVQMGELSGLDLLSAIKQHNEALPVILMTAFGKIDDAVKAMQLGAVDYLTKPFAPQVLLNLVDKHAPLFAAETNQPIVGDSSSEALLQLAKKVAVTDASVMITGPSGSGKEVLARFVHNHSKRQQAPFVAINCAAIPENMLEATLFGYEKGAFTGALQAYPGKFEQAQGGTILLDEITEMDLSLQAKLLRVLQEREVERLGGRKAISLDVRVLATSNRDLKEYVQAGEFREDLFYRLNVFPLQWLPLAQRPGDILPLAEYLLNKHQGQSHMQFAASAVQRMTQHTWPGNVRELDNVIQRAVILQENGVITAQDLLLETDVQIPARDHHGEPYQSDAEQPRLGTELQQQEHQIILEMLEQCRGKRKDVADKLGISPRTLRYKLAKMREVGIDLPY
jgi:two-component system response regulator FlrC